MESFPAMDVFICTKFNIYVNRFIIYIRLKNTASAFNHFAFDGLPYSQSGNGKQLKLDATLPNIFVSRSPLKRFSILQGQCENKVTAHLNADMKPKNPRK
jgi:hypothetical protein